MTVSFRPGLLFDAVIVTAGGWPGRIVTDVETRSVNPLASVAVALTTKLPSLLYVCWTVVDPLIAPSDCVVPSPKFTVTSVTFAVAPTPTVNVAGTPADTGVVGPAIVTPVRGL